MYDEFIDKMTKHFSEVGSILYSKACDFSKKNPISPEDITMYYEILCSNENIPDNISRENHKMCCLYYISKQSNEYIDTFVEKYVKSIDVNTLEIKSEHLYRIFNIIEYDKTYLDSPKENLEFLYQLLKLFANFETDFNCFIIYKYYRGYLKYKFGDLAQSEKEYLEIVAELSGNDEFLMKYIKLLADLLNIKRLNLSESQKASKASLNEYIQILKKLFDDVKGINPILALKLGFDLFSAYIEAKDYRNSLKLIIEMKYMLKNTLLKGSAMKNGIYYYLAISSRFGYLGILLGDQNIISNAIDKIKKSLKLISDIKNDEKLNQINKSYIFIQAILEIGLNNKTNLNMKELASTFQKEFLPELGSNIYNNSIITKQNKESIIVDFLIINNMNKDYYDCTKSIMEKYYKELISNNFEYYNNSYFMVFLAIVHEKIYRYTESYITDLNNNKKKDYIKRMGEYFKTISKLINKYIGLEPFLKTHYSKLMIINIYYAYGSILLKEKDINEDFKEIINEIIDISDNKDKTNLKQLLNIDKNIKEYGLWLKLLGDYYQYMKKYDAAINRYEAALKTLENNHPLTPLVSFNCATSYFFEGKKKECMNYLNKCISQYNNLLINSTNSPRFFENPDEIIKKKNLAKKLLDELSKV